MKKSPVVITEPAAVAALKEIYQTNGPGNLEWDFSIPGQVTAQDGRLEAQDGALTGLNLDRAGLKGVLKLRGVKTLAVFTAVGNINSDGTYLEDMPGLAEGVKLLRQAAEQGDPEAWFKLGYAYRQGDVVEQDMAEAIKWLRLAAVQGDSEAQLELGRTYSFEENEAEAVKWYRLAAEQGHAEAQYLLGNSYYYGEGVEEDKAEAVKWYRLAAKQGHAKAQVNLAYAYYWGEGVEEDKAESFKWDRLAAEQGQAVALFSVACAYRFGEGIEEDKAESVKWYRLAAEQGDTDARISLASAYRLGEGVEEDKAEAVKWYRLAAEQGDADAQFSLGLAYSLGEGVEEDKAEAVRWFREAAEQGHDAAQYNLGSAYYFGEGVKEDKGEAEKWFRFAVGYGYCLSPHTCKGCGDMREKLLLEVRAEHTSEGGDDMSREERLLEVDEERGKIIAEGERGQGLFTSSYALPSDPDYSDEVPLTHLYFTASLSRKHDDVFYLYALKTYDGAADDTALEQADLEYAVKMNPGNHEKRARRAIELLKAGVEITPYFLLRERKSGSALVEVVGVVDVYNFDSDGVARAINMFLDLGETDYVGEKLVHRASEGYLEYLERNLEEELEVAALPHFYRNYQIFPKT